MFPVWVLSGIYDYWKSGAYAKTWFPFETKQQEVPPQKRESKKHTHREFLKTAMTIKSWNHLKSGWRTDMNPHRIEF